jgi:hypothetical protein
MNNMKNRKFSRWGNFSTVLKISVKGNTKFLNCIIGFELNET